MAYITISSGLTLQVPTVGTRNWSTTFLDEFARKISSHDHTGSGKGLQIGASALSTNAVIAAKIASDAVTTAKILDSNVTTAKIAADAVTDAKILLRNNQWLRGRNAAGLADVNLLKLNASDVLEFAAALQILTANLADGAVTEAKLDTDAATRSCQFFHGWNSGVNGTVVVPLYYPGSTGFYRWIPPKAGKITHLAIEGQDGISRATGSIVMQIYKNTVLQAGSTLTLNTTVDRLVGAVTPVTFAADDELYFNFSCTSFTWAIGDEAIGRVYGHFTE